MRRCLLPLILASLGSTLFALAINMPLFEWQVSEIVAYPQYNIQFNPSPWIAKFGDSLDNGSVIFSQFNNSYCGNDFGPEKLRIMVKRTWSEEVLERITRNINHSIIPMLWFLILLSGVYLWWCSIYYKHSVVKTLLLTVVAAIFLCVLLDISRPLFAIIGSSGCFEGAITFKARLSKIHYETLLIFFAAITAEIAALCIMFFQIIKAAGERIR
jgi:hypothetical protein